MKNELREILESCEYAVFAIANKSREGWGGRFIFPGLESADVPRTEISPAPTFGRALFVGARFRAQLGRTYDSPEQRRFLGYGGRGHFSGKRNP